MLIIDTSVWVCYFRGGDAKLVCQLRDFLDEDQVALAAPIRVELLSGAKAVEIKLLKRVLSALPNYLPSAAAWDMVEKWAETSRAKGHAFGAMDLLIAAIAHEQAARLWSLDKDFQRMESLGFVRLHHA